MDDWNIDDFNFNSMDGRRDRQAEMEVWARAAGDVLKKHFRQLKHIGEKRTIDLVTIADEEAEKISTVQEAVNYINSNS